MKRTRSPTMQYHGIVTEANAERPLSLPGAASLEAVGLFLFAVLVLPSAGLASEPLAQATAEGESTIEDVYAIGQSWWQDLGTMLGGTTESPFDAEARAWQEREAHFRAIWGQLLPRLDAAIGVVERRGQAPESAFFSKDQKDFNEDYREILEKIASILEGTQIIDFQRHMAMLKRRIRDAHEEISRLHEERLVAPESGLLATTKADIARKIQHEIEAIGGYEQSILDTRSAFVAGLRRMGIVLSPEQAEVLLARVDADNIVRMAVVFDTLKSVTTQLAGIMSTSGENVDYQRYYGMHVVLLDVALLMQNRYIQAIDEVYLPRLDDIVGRASEISRESIRIVRRETSEERRKVYKSNILANRLTIETARLYMKQIETQRQRVVSARHAMEQDLALARSTYETVSISTELLSILEDSQRSFDVLMRLEIPEIEPFPNNEVLKKFEEISAAITDS